VKNIIFIAPPAAGKGTLSEFLVKEYGYQHISTGALFREKIKIQDEEAKELEKMIQAGHLIDDKRLFSLLQNKLKTLSKNENFILDGVPRTLQQAHILDIILRDLGFSDYIVIYVHMEKETLKKRMTGRRICSSCQSTYNIYFEKFKPHKENTCDICGNSLIQRVDDNEDSFNVRYTIFQNNNEPIIKYYQDQNRLWKLNNEDEDISRTLKELQRIVV